MEVILRYIHDVSSLGKMVLKYHENRIKKKLILTKQPSSLT